MAYQGPALGSNDQYNRLLRCLQLQKNILGLVQGASARIDLEFKGDRGQPYKKTASVKGKNGETEDLPLYTNKDDIFGEVRRGW